jgi:ABC-type transport system involved in cytochrome c biogenesis ATPase subunit
MEQQIERKVMGLTNDKTEILAEQTGIKPSLSSDEAIQYLHEVLNKSSKTIINSERYLRTT